MSETPPPDQHLRGIAYRIGAALSLATMNAFMKFAGDHGVSAVEIFGWRNVLSFPVILGWVLIGPGLASLRTARPLGHVFRSVLGLGAMMMMFQAIVRLPLAEATTIIFSAPIWGTLFSALLIGEVVGRQRWAAVLVGFVGIVLAAAPGSGAVPALGAALALGAAVTQALVMITLRQLGRTDSTAAIVFWFTAIGTLAGVVALVPVIGPHPPVVWAALIAGGLFGAMGQVFVTAALRHAPVSVVVPFDYLQIVWAILLGWLIFALPPLPTTLAGAALVAGSGIYTAYRERRRADIPPVAQGPADA